MVKERMVNILKRVTFKHFVIIDIDNLNDSMVSATVQNSVTGQTYPVHFPLDMIERWYSNNNLKYDLVKEYILTNISEDYNSIEEDIYGR
ncbi:MAG: hypothetical protein L0K90_08240 [Staphylococcus equorum]|nr:hypothetical protein [Staphylococcus equorum]